VPLGSFLPPVSPRISQGNTVVSASTHSRFQRTADPRHDKGEGDALLLRAVAATKSGDVSALHFLYVRYADDVRGYVQSIVRERHDAEDITQNVFAKLPRAIRTYERREVPFAAWILRVARNAAVDHMRSRRPVPCEEVRTSDQGYEQVGFERSQSLRDALERLPEEQREVLVLRHVAGLSPGEIAQRLHKTEGSIHGLHHRGRRALRAALVELEAAPVTNNAAPARNNS
jgi:RNA polymerase sigma-70 factor, ECF subfamily